MNAVVVFKTLIGIKQKILKTYDCLIDRVMCLWIYFVLPLSKTLKIQTSSDQGVGSGLLAVFSVMNFCKKNRIDLRVSLTGKQLKKQRHGVWGIGSEVWSTLFEKNHFHYGSEGRGSFWIRDKRESLFPSSHIFRKAMRRLLVADQYRNIGNLAWLRFVQSKMLGIEEMKGLVEEVPIKSGILKKVAAFADQYMIGKDVAGLHLPRNR